MSKSLSIAIAGIAGRMGRQLAGTALSNGHRVIGGTEQETSEHLASDIGILAGTAATHKTPTPHVSEAARGASVWIDFTTPSATLEALKKLYGSSVKTVIIGTTGFAAEEDAAIEEHCERFAIVKAGNFSLGIAMLCALTRLAAERLGSDWDIDILEAHHRHKMDAPSGTALMLGEAAAGARGHTLNDLQDAPYFGATAKRTEGKIGFSVSRIGGVIGEHEVRFGNETETISLSHTALDRRVFAEGAIKSAEWAGNQPPGMYNITDVLGL